jgi:hypothetical protein
MNPGATVTVSRIGGGAELPDDPVELHPAARAAAQSAEEMSGFMPL